MGWTKTGDAFDFQPTFGDNPRGRSVYGGAGDRRANGDAQQSGLRGRYYVGTFEARPGAGAHTAYTRPHPDRPQGTSQGDGPVGTLTSQPFALGGPAISFLLGGGCDPLKVYVELLVDGVAVDRATVRKDQTKVKEGGGVALGWDVRETA